MNKIINRRIALFCALALLSGVFVGGLIADNLVLTIIIPVALVAMGIIFLCNKFKTVFLLYFCLALGVSAFAVDYAIGHPMTEGNFEVSARIEKTGNGYYYADDITFDGKGYGGKIVIYTDEKLNAGDKVEFCGKVSKIEFDLFGPLGKGYFSDRVYYSVHPSFISVVGTEKTFTEKIIDRITNPMFEFMDARDAGIMKSLLFGDKSDMSYSDKRLFSDVGLSHIFALSGLHVGFLVALILFVARKCKMGKKSTVILCTAFLIVFGVLTGFPSGLKRATVMTVCALSASLFRRKNDSLNTLSVAVFVIVLTNPRELFDLSFIMSVSAVLGIITFHKPISKFLSGKSKNKLRKYLSEGVALTVSANILLFPVMCNVFGSVAVYSVLANIVILPIVSITFSLLAVVAILTCVFSGFGVLYYIIQYPIIAIRIICKWIYALPFASVGVTGMGVATAFYLLSAVVLSRFVKLNVKAKSIIVCALCVLGCTSFVIF